MIDYTCRSCGKPMSSPDCLTDQLDQCISCGEYTKVPQPSNSADTPAPVCEIVSMPTCSRIGWPVSILRWFFGCYKASPWKAAIWTILILSLVAGGIIGLNFHLGRLESRARAARIKEAQAGLFPPRAELEKVLAKYKYFPIQPDQTPVSKILRGRRLNAFSYVYDANYPYSTMVYLYCPAGKTEHIIAMSTTALYEIAIEPVPSFTKFRSTNNHAFISNELFVDIGGIHPKETKFVELDPGLKSDEVYFFRYSLIRDGFELEHLVQPYKKPKPVVGIEGVDKLKFRLRGLILKDRTWRQSP